MQQSVSISAVAESLREPSWCRPASDLCYSCRTAGGPTYTENIKGDVSIMIAVLVIGSHLRGNRQAHARAS